MNDPEYTLLAGPAGTVIFDLPIKKALQVVTDAIRGAEAEGWPYAKVGTERTGYAWIGVAALRQSSLRTAQPKQDSRLLVPPPHQDPFLGPNGRG